MYTIYYIYYTIYFIYLFSYNIYVRPYILFILPYIKYVYIYVCMLSLRRSIASACVTGVINTMVSDAQRVTDCGQSCTAGSIWSHTIRVPRRTFQQSGFGMITFSPATE